MPYSQAQSAGLANQDVQAVIDAMASDARLSQLEDNVPSNVEFTVDDYLKGIDVSDGISTDETNLAFDLLSSNAVTVADIAAKTGIPASAIQSTYDTMVAANASQAAADLEAEIAAADAEERRVTGSLNEFGETYAEEQARLALERSAANDAIMQANAADAAALAAEAAERKAQEDADRAATQNAADSSDAAATQAKDDDFDTKVNAAGGVTPGTIDKVIDIALEVYGDNSRGVVKVISESLKGGLTMKDLEEATDLSGEEIMAAAKTAANDPNKSLTPGEILSGAANTVYDTTNKIVDIVEKGLEVTGIEKVIDIIGNTVSKVVGLDPSNTKKVLVVNPVTGQVTVQASNQPNGGILGSLPQSPYVPIGTTSGGTTYGVDAENAIINTVLGKIITKGGLDQGDTTSIIGAAVEETLGIPTEVTVGVIKDAADLAKGAAKVIKDSGVLAGSGSRQDDEEAATTGFEVVTGGEGNDTITGGTGNDTITGGTGNDTSVSATDGLMGPFQLDEDGNTIVDTGQSNTTITAGTGNDTITAGTGNDTITRGEGDDTITAGSGATLSLNEQTEVVCGKNQYKDFVTGQCVDIPCPTSGDVRNKNGDCYTPGPTGRTAVDEDLTVADVTANTPCDNADEIRDPVTLVCGKPTSGQTKVCPKGTKLADQTVDINTDCGTIGGQTKVCPKGTKLADQTVDINADCGVIDDDKTVVIDGVTNVVNYVCKEEGAVYNPVTERCEKTTTTTIDDVTNLTEVSCSAEGAQYDASMNNGAGGCYIDNSRVIDTVTDRTQEVSCSAEGAQYDATMNNGAGGCYIDNSRVIDTVTDRTQEVSCSAEGAQYDATMNNGEGGCYIDNSRVITETIDRTNITTEYVCEEGVLDTTTNKCVNTLTGDVITNTICRDGSAPDADGNCLVTTFGNALTQTVCETGTWDETLQKCVNTVNGNVITQTVCEDGSAPDADGNCLVTITGDVITNFSCPEGSYEIEGVCYNDVTGEVVENTVCPAGQTLNTATNLCEYTKVLCGAGFTLNILTGQCEPDESEEVEGATRPIVPPASLNLAGRGDFVGRDDVLVENLGDVGGIYSILPAPVRESFLADRRQQDIRNVADTVGIQQGGGLEQDQAAVDRFAGYANAFDVGLPELLDISGVTPGDVPAYEDKFNVQFPVTGIAPPVAPATSISDVRYDPTSYVPTAMARGGVVESESGIESLLDRRQSAVNRMLAKRAGSYFGQ